MRRTFSHRVRSCLTAASVASSMFAVSQVAAQQFGLQHYNRISLSPLFFGPGTMGEPASDFGWNPLSVAFDGTHAFVGGFNGGSLAGNAGIVRVDNVLGGAPTLTALHSTVFAASALRGIDYMTATSSGVFAVYDDGTGNGFIRRYDSGGTQQWSKTPGVDIVAGYRPSAIGIDPLGNAGSPGLGMVGVGSGRRAVLDLSNGNVIFGPSGFAGPLGEIINPNPPSVSGVSLGFTYRGIAFDSAGNIAVAAQGGASYANRDTQGGTNFNRFVNLNGISSATTPIAVKQTNADPAGFVGQGLGFLEGLGTQTLLAVSSRVGSPFALELRSAVAGVPPQTGLDSQNVHIVTTTGAVPGALLNPTLRGNEDGIGSFWSQDIKGITVGRDANNNSVLFVVSFVNRTLDIYSLEPAWNAPAGGVWSDAANWFDNVVPNNLLDNARFGNAIIAPATVTVDGPKTVKVIKFDNPNKYTLAGPGSITLDSPGTPQINVLQGNHDVAVPVQLARDTQFNVVAGSTLSARKFTGAGMTINSGTVRLIPDGTASATSKVTSLNIEGATLPTATLDISNNALVVDYTPAPDAEPFDTIKAQITFAYNNGAWNNSGITSSQANASQFGIGYAEASSLTSIPAIFGTVDSDSVLIRFTRYGDANLDGTVGLPDFNRLAGNFGSAGANWDQGDFNYDGLINLQDFNRLAANFGLSAASDGPTPEDWSNLASVVPEPGSFVLVALGLAGFLKRNRR